MKLAIAAGIILTLALLALLEFSGRDENASSPDAIQPAPATAPAQTSATQPIGAARDKRQTGAPMPVAREDDCAILDAELNVEIDLSSIDLTKLASDVVPALQVSASAEHQLAAGLLAWPDHRAESLQLLLRARELNNSRPLIAVHLLHVCGQQLEQCPLPLSLLEQEAIEADRANGHVWMQVARSRLQRGDTDGALVALREAVAAAEFDGRWIELLGTIERGLASSADLTSRRRLMVAFSLVGAKSLSAAPMYSECVAQSKSSGEWLDVCIRLGERLEFSSRTVLNQKLGQELQSQMYARSGDTRQQGLVDKRHDELDRRYDQLTSTMVDAGLEPAESLLRSYIDAFAAGDEIAALEYVGSEVQRLILAREKCAAPP